MKQENHDVDTPCEVLPLLLLAYHVEQRSDHDKMPRTFKIVQYWTSMKNKEEKESQKTL